MAERPTEETPYEDGPFVFKTIISDLFNLSGLRLIWLKFSPNWDPSGIPHTRKPASGMLWAIGIYTALFGIASGRYESALDRIENRQAGIYAQLGSESWLGALSRIPQSQKMRRPVQPNISDLGSILVSLFGESIPDRENVAALSAIVEASRRDLGGVQLKDVQLKRAELTGAKFFRADLMNANLVNADLRGAVLKAANLMVANLCGADLTQADLSETNIFQANLFDANLSRADLRGAMPLMQSQLDEALVYEGQPAMIDSKLSQPPVRLVPNLTMGSTKSIACMNSHPLSSNMSRAVIPFRIGGGR